MNKNERKYRYLFGPVPSRRLGVSLGVDLVQPKTCSLDCIYCESGKTTQLSLKRREYVKVKDVMGELELFLADRPELDYVTFSGSGEPTMNTGIGDVVRFIKGNYSGYKVALLTNSTLLVDKKLCFDLIESDLVVASLDAVSENIFQKINRPAEGLTAGSLIEGLVEFRDMYKHNLCLEIFIVPGLNDSDEELLKLREAVIKINPDSIQLNSLDRPGAEQWVVSAGKSCISKALKILDGSEKIGSFQKCRKKPAGTGEVSDRVYNMVLRRPCTVDDIAVAFELDEGSAMTILLEMVDQGLIFTEKRERGVFFRAQV